LFLAAWIPVSLYTETKRCVVHESGISPTRAPQTQSVKREIKDKPPKMESAPCQRSPTLQTKMVVG
jgi:hypothetical protein